MKIKKLVLQNINSLYGKWEIDFDCEKFAQSGIFAITGKTGSGKSSILDAICMALYGVTPRLERDTVEAVSRGCNECMCELTFLDTDGKEWMATFAYRANLRGSNRGRLNETAIHRLSCDGKTVADRTTNVRKKVEEIIGLDSTRFCRAVMLAQGSFDAFLNAGKDNGEILERITGTEIYSRIAEKLKERYNDEKNKLAAIQIQFDGIEIMPSEEAEKLAQEVAALDKEIAGFVAEQNALNQLLQKFDQLDLFTRNLAKCSEDEKVLAEDEGAFAVQKKRFEAGRNVLEADKKYRPYKALSDQLAAALTALQKNEELFQSQEKLCAESQQKLAAASAEAEKFDKEFEALVKVLAEVNELDTIIRTLDSNVSAAGKRRADEVHSALNCRRELAENRSKLADLEKNHSEATAYLAAHAKDGELTAVQTICQEWLKNFESYSQTLVRDQKQSSALQKEIANAQKLIAEKSALLKTEVEKLEKISAGEVKAQQEVAEALSGTAREQWQELYDTHNKLYQQTLLCKSLEDHRKQLQDGVECPLCGAKEHPFALGNIPEPEQELKKLQELKVRLDDIDKAEKALLKIRETLNACSNAKLQAQNALDQLQIQLDGKVQAHNAVLENIQKVQNELAQTAGKIDNALAPFGLTWDQKNCTLADELALRIKKFAGFQAAQAIFNEKKSELQDAILRLRSALKNHLGNSRILKRDWLNELVKRSDAKAKRTELFGDKNSADEGRKAEENRSALAAARAKAQQVYTEISTNRSRTAEDVKKLNTAIAELNEQIVSARESFVQACNAAKVTEDEFLSCVLTAEEMTALSAKDADLKSRRKQLTESRTLCEKEIKTLSAFLEDKKSKEDVAAEQKALSQLLLDKNQLAGGLKQKISQDTENKQKMAEQHAKLLEQKKVMELWQRLYDLIGVKDRFQRFAQGITLEHLLVLANLELEKLSGRYRLLRSKDEELGIDVADKDQGDEIRGCKTLSGGERFLVSLALALGLAQMAGEKIRVDSLFLDEGFGTLDAETLDTALAALNSLRSRGKLVGVISHVAGFSEKIPCVIEVNKSGGGRSTLQGPGVKAL